MARSEVVIGAVCAVLVGVVIGAFAWARVHEREARENVDRGAEAAASVRAQAARDLAALRDAAAD